MQIDNPDNTENRICCPYVWQYYCNVC